MRRIGVSDNKNDEDAYSREPAKYPSVYIYLEFIINIALEIDNESSNTYIMHFVKYFWPC
jgi:hypothetical protein